MRQVPAFDPAPIGIVGNFRVTRDFLHHFNLLGLAVRGSSRRVPGGGPIEALGPCRTALLLIRDWEIVPLIDACPGLQEQRRVHFSVSVVTRTATGTHPVMTFGHDLCDVATYCSIRLILESCGTRSHPLLPGMRNPFRILRCDRPSSHALCVMAGNLSTVVSLKLFHELEDRSGIPAPAAYLAQTPANLLITAPLARRDGETTRASLKPLEGDPFHGVCPALVRAYEHGS
jgi:hypothetical protein